MGRLRLPWFICFVVFAVSGCAGTTFNGVWKDPAYTSPDWKRVMVLAVAESESNRRLFEGAMVGELEERQIRVVPGHSVIGSADDISRETLAPIVKSRGIDAVLVTRLVRIDDNVEYVPGETYVVPAHYQRMYGYYDDSYVIVTKPGYYEETQTVVLETNAYDTETEELVWSAVSETYNPRDARSAIVEICSAITDQLSEDGLVGKK